jgi:hypothetical protein
MNWNEIRSAYPDKWLVVEALVAHTDPNNKRIISDLKVIEICSDGISAFNKYRELHKLEPCKEYYYLNTNRVVLEIEERKWVGIRIQSAASNQE